MFRNRHASGLIVVDDDRAVLANVDAIGAGSQLKVRGELERAYDFGVCPLGEGPPRGLGRGEPAGELLEGRPPEGLHARGAAKLLEGTIREGKQLGVNVGRQTVG